MEVKIKLTPFMKCTVYGHESHDHSFGRGKCHNGDCNCIHFTPPAPQIIKEIEWILHNFKESKTPEQKLKWKQKLDNWGRGHPKEYDSLLRELLEMLEKL